MVQQIYFIIVLISFCSCKGNTQEVINVLPTETKDLKIYKDTVKFATPGTTHEFPYLFPSLDYSGNTFAGLDERTSTINLMDLESMEIIKSIPLYQEGPNAIQSNMIGTLLYHNQDSIFVLQHIPNRLLIINNNAEIIWQKDLKELFNKVSRLKGLTAYGLFDRIAIFFQNEKLFFALRQNKASQDFLYPIIGYYDFETDKINALEIHYPNFYTTNEQVGSYGFPSITYYDKDIMIVFPYTADIFIYDLNGNLRKHVKHPSRFKMGKAQEPGEPKKVHFKNNPLYRNIQPFQNGKYFLMLYQKHMSSNPDEEIFRGTIIYNSDLTKFSVIKKNTPPISFGGEYFYYPIPQEETGYQLLERYKVEMK